MRVGNAGVAQHALHALEVGQRFGTEIVDQLRRRGAQILQRRILGIENAQRVGIEATLAVLVEQLGVFLEIGDQRGAMLGALFRLAETVELQFDAVQPEVGPQTGAHQDHFGIDIGTGIAERLDADLVELAVTPLLRPLVAVHLADVIEALRLAGDQVVLDDGTHAAGRPFRAQGQRLAVEAVDEGIHFLLDDVGDFADGALEQRRRLDDRQADRAVAVGLQPRPDGVLEQLPECRFVGQDVVHPAHGL